MEKICEFCSALRPIVFCKADSAFLCLSCDAKVHSANALSNRHFRCLVCESCREQQAHIRCVDHRMLLCRACDIDFHENIINQHQRRMVSSFSGSPSAKQFAMLCGFNTSHLGFDDQLAGPSSSSVSAASVVSTDFSLRSSHSEQNKMAGNAEQQSSLIMQQILDLNRLQLNENNNPSPAIRERGQADSSSSCVYNSLRRIDECLEDATMRESNGPAEDLNAFKDHHFLPSPFSQFEYLSSYASTSALDSNQFWPQNLEDPRFSEEIHGLDDFKMPEVDLTFPNFEDLLKGDHDLSKALLEDNSTAFFCSENDPHSPQVTGISMNLDKTNSNENQNTIMRPTYSYSYSFSHLSVESSDCHDSGHSSSNNEGNRFRDKKKSRLHKQTQLSPRKNKAEANRGVKGGKNHGMKATRSC